MLHHDLILFSEENSLQTIVQNEETMFEQI